MAAVALTACNDEAAMPFDPTVIPEASDPQRAMLIYAVASNNLYYYLSKDMTEMIAGATSVDLKNNRVVVYSVTPDGASTLSQLIAVPGKSAPEFHVIKEYPRLPLSVSRERISEVIGDFCEMYDEYPHKSLTFWSHASGWTPSFTTLPHSLFPPRAVEMKSFGADYYEGREYNCNITDLADAVPEGVFDFIWFDCCYMSNIETLYQMRDKCDYLVAYPTEVYATGLPYDQILPLVMKGDADLGAAAGALFRYYDSNEMAVTVSVVRTDRLGEIAAAAADIIDDSCPPQKLSLRNYATGGLGPFFDMRHTLTQYAAATSDKTARLDQAMQAAVVFTIASERDFRGNVIEPEKYSGMTIHLPDDDYQSPYNCFYRELDWYRDTRNEFPL